MNSSSYTERLRNETLYMWRLRNNGQEQKGDITADVLSSRMNGGISLYNLGILPEAPPPNGEILTCKDICLTTCKSLLSYIATTNPGPTRTSRLLYLWSSTMAMLYAHVSPTPSRIEGVKGGWDWSVRIPLSDDTDRVVWMLHGCIACMANYVPSFDSTSLLQEERDVFGWSLEVQEQRVRDMHAKAGWSTWKANWDNWWSIRQNDGYVSAGVAPTSSELPNGSSSLDVSQTVDPSSFAQPTKWTPLSIQGKTQKYLTYTWNNVLSTGLDSSAETSIKSAALAFYPNTSDRLTEVAEVVSITAGLSDQEKMIAEFWAGGPGTVSPPGMFMWFWKECVKGQTLSEEKTVYSCLELGIHLFEISRLIWGLKHDQMQARPIQEIRRLYRGQTLVGYDGLAVAGESWVPYQETNFVTPPFADFPSGHSAFSQVFALVMSKWFGASLPSITVTSTDVNLLSPTLEAQAHAFGSFTMNTGKSQVQIGVVPSAPVTVTWNTWQEMADEAGISRKYGGIHCTSAHTASQAAAQECFNQLQTVWNI
jgi:hypothetical protein